MDDVSILFFSAPLCGILTGVACEGECLRDLHVQPHQKNAFNKPAPEYGGDYGTAPFLCNTTLDPTGVIEPSKKEEQEAY